jgi:hypothetical protein
MQFLEPMKNRIFIIIILFFDLTYGFGQNNVGIGTNTPDSNAILEMNATDKGILIPRMTSTQRNNMTPSLGLTQEGLLVYDNDSTKFFYWNGYSWQTFGSGAMGPQGPSGICPSRHYIGEHYQGGIIFFVDSSGQHGLIISSVDVGNQLYSNITDTLIGSSAQNYYDGLINSNAIVAQPFHSWSAASLCLSYNGGGYSDWYLPSVFELILASTVSYAIPGITNYTSCFWSSTEFDSHSAYAVSFFNNNCSGSKNMAYEIRAIRKF